MARSKAASTPGRRRDPAATFLKIIAVLIVLTILGAFAYRIWGTQLMRLAMVPSAEFKAVPMPPGSSYDSPALWIARPDIPNNPAAWRPSGVEAGGEPRASLFFIHPTSFLQRTAWNAPLTDQESQWRAALFVRSQASAFNGVAEIWAPKYRQATFGAFLTKREDAARALDFAYRDVLAAYEAFLRQAPRDRPIILAGHSQGSLHLLRLLHERVKGTPEARRIAAAYVIGWPVSATADMPALPLPACVRPDQGRCLLSWQSFAMPADTDQVTDVFDASAGFTGAPRAGSPMVCTNPLTGAANSAADANANLGTLVPNGQLTDGTLRPRQVPARCDVRGFLLIGQDPPDMGAYVLPGNNYHVYDYALFWANIRADADRRLRATGR